MYAIIEDGGAQIKVSKGDVIRVAKRQVPSEVATLTFDKVLMVGDGETQGKTQVGRPYLSGAKVTADILGAGRTEKVVGVKMKRRKNYRRKFGHRQDFLKVKITSIQA